MIKVKLLNSDDEHINVILNRVTNNGTFMVYTSYPMYRNWPFSGFSYKKILIIRYKSIDFNKLKLHNSHRILICQYTKKGESDILKQ